MSKEISQQILSGVKAINVENLYETGCTNKLAEWLGCRREVRYPGSDWKCDLVIPGDDNKETWIEIKFAWTYTTDKTPDKSNSKFKKHLLDDPEESAVVDVRRKLKSLLNCPHVSGIGFLLVVFDSRFFPFKEEYLAAFKEQAGLMDAPWLKTEEPAWVNPRNPQCSIRAYYWQRTAERLVESCDR
ncbi:MAG TPA: hypothetical protein PKU74_08180 [Candidatus Omnitrophota bacterium]|nr:hypothetical protein [Candidatus Omnitrophota bacterium]